VGRLREVCAGYDGQAGNYYRWLRRGYVARNCYDAGREIIIGAGLRSGRLDPKTPCAKVPWNIVIPKCWPSFRTAFFFTQNYTHDIVKSNIEITKLVISI
jgi:hypothetical protein